MILLNQILLFLLAQFVYAEGDNQEEEIPQELTPEAFTNMNGTYLIEFFSPYCSHCKELAPKWQKAYRTVGGSQAPGFAWASLNCVEFGDTCKSENIRGYPTIRVYRDGSPIYEYTKRGNEDTDLVDFAKKFVDNGDSAFSTDTGKLIEPKKSEPDSKSDSKTDSEKPPIMEQAKEQISSAVSDSPVFEQIPYNNLTDALLDGKWIVYFIKNDCHDCDIDIKMWKEEQARQAAPGYKWAAYVCDPNKGGICSVLGITKFPTMRIYDKSQLLGESDNLGKVNEVQEFIKRKLPAPKKPINLKPEPKSSISPKVEGPELPYPTTVDDVSRFPLPADPAKLIFGDVKDYNDRMPPYKDVNAPVPKLLVQKEKHSYADGKIHELTESEFIVLVKTGVEPWIIKFHSPGCGHCREMAPEYEKMAKKANGMINVGAINCDTYLDLCRAEGVKAYPTINNYVGKYKAENYVGKFTSEMMLKYAKLGSNVMVPDVKDVTELSDLLLNDFDEGLNTFVYVYDKSVTEEDWESLSDLAHAIAPWGGRIYKTNDPDLRKLSKTDFRGNGLIHAVRANLNKDKKRDIIFTQFPLLEIPKRMRDVDEVSAWAYRQRFLIPQKLEPKEIQGYNNYTMLYLYDGNFKIRDNTEFNDFYLAAIQVLENDIKANTKLHDEYRIERLKQIDRLLVESNYKDAFQLTREPLITPFVQNVSFAYLDVNVFKSLYGELFNNLEVTVGSTILVDFYNANYVHEINGNELKFNMDDIKRSVEWLTEASLKKGRNHEVKRLTKKVDSTPKPQSSVLKKNEDFVNPLPAENSTVGRRFFAILVISIIGTVFYIYVCRPFLFPWLRKRSNKA